MIKEKKKDERIVKENARIASKVFPLGVVLAVASLSFKLCKGLPFPAYLLDIVALAVPVLVFVISEIKDGIFLVRKSDDALKELADQAGNRGFLTLFSIELIGELIQYYVVDEYGLWILCNLATWFVPALLYTIYSIRHGLLISGTRKKEKASKKSLLISTVTAAPLFGGSMFLVQYLVLGTVELFMVWIAIGSAVAWGIIFYALMRLAMRKAEKNAEKLVEQAEQSEV